MYTYKPQTDASIIFTALANHKSLLEKDVKIEGLPIILKKEFERTIKRIDEILEEI